MRPSSPPPHWTTGNTPFPPNVDFELYIQRSCSTVCVSRLMHIDPVSLMQPERERERESGEGERGCVCVCDIVCFVCMRL